MDLRAVLRRLLPIMLLLAAVAALIARRRRRATGQAPYATRELAAGKRLALPAPHAEPTFLTAQPAAAPVGVVRAAAPSRPRFAHERVDIVTVVDDLLAARAS